MNTAKIYPGMLCNSVEFFLHNDKLQFLQHGSVKDFTELPFNSIQVLKEYIDRNTDVKVALMEFHPNSEMRRIEQFTKCRFGGLDFSPDIDNGFLQDGEFWDCPMRGNCEHEGTLCKLPSINGNRLTTTDIELMQLTATNKTNDVIAEEMNLPLGSFHQVKKFLYEKLGVQTKQEVTRTATFLNII